MEPLQRLKCQWCESLNTTDAVSCQSCGGSLGVAALVTDSGWREAPRLRDRTEIRFQGSVCQVEGEVVPVAEIQLGAESRIFFEHRALLWKDILVRLDVMPLAGGVKRMLAGMPFFITLATGPGRLAFSRDSSGELVVMPLHPGMEVDVREHAFLLASSHIQYSFVRIQGLRNILLGGQGMFMDRFVTNTTPGLLVLHGYGNVFERTLAPGETMVVEPGAFLYKDSSVDMKAETLQLTSGLLGGTRMKLARLTGPGRIAIQSMYHHHVTE
ncbi:MAG TPA: AIM24 family protein [Armatimonadota bacterium]|nr:AIM24 family protein [Armatimonadota bacterium]